MTVYLGSSGAVQIKRKSGQPVRGTLVPSDVSVDKRRFSLNDYEVWGELISGDQVDLAREGGGDLELVAGHNHPDWRGFVFIDQLGGIRLYDNFVDAISGSLDTALELVQPSVTQSIRLQTRNARYQYLAKLQGYELTTARESVDITQLGDQFKRQYEAGLISGQGRLDCFFEFQSELCAPDGCAPGAEFSMYLAQLCIRLTQGADFNGRFFVYHPDSDDDDVRGNKQSVWYEAECIITNCTVNVQATTAIESTIEFVTTSRIKLLTGVPPSYLLQENSDLILQEDGDSRIVLAGQDV